MQEVFGTQNLITNTGELKIAELSEAKIVGIYFTAHWCPPCRTFTPKLISLYKNQNASQKVMEIVFVSYDRDSDTMNNYFEEMPWAAVPYSEKSLRESLGQKYGVTGIPALVVFSSNGTLISSDGRTDVYSKNAEVVEYWIKKSESPNAGQAEEVIPDSEVEVANIPRDPIEGLVCDKNHNLIWHGDVGKFYSENLGSPNIFCDYCRVTLKRSSWHCRQCHFDLCKDCKDWVVESKKLNNPNLRCWKLHNLLLTDRLKETYLKKLGSEKYTCRCCNSVLNGNNLHCRRCYFDICNSCQSIIETSAPIASKAKCTGGHPIMWNLDLSFTYQQIYGAGRYSCNGCSRVYAGAGSFGCVACTYDICVLCISPLLQNIAI